MNEQKVKELILAAGAEYHFSGDIVTKHMETFAKKLIELTMRECAEIFGQEETSRYEVDGNWIAKTIKQYFGVKE
jgi:hypothetical protein